MTIIVMLLGLLALIIINVPIAVALGVVSIAAMVLTQGTDTLPNVALTMYSGATSFPLLAIPMFVLAGAIMNSSGISRRLIAFASALLGFIRGGLAMINVGVSLFFAEISGSAVADVAATGSILIPAMKKRGYPPAFAAAITSSSASLAIIIPPSIPMILYGVMSGSSIIQLFVAGVIPGLIGAAGLMIMSYVMARRHNWPVEEVFQVKRVLETGRDAGWALLLPVVILGAIFSGLVTATEGAGLAVLASLVIGGLIYRELDARFLWESLLDGAKQTAVVMLLVASSALVGIYLTEMRIPQEIASSILGFSDNKYLILLFLNVMFLIIGMFLHSAAAIILVVPVVMPLVLALGIDPVHFGLIVCLNLAIGQQTPPVASVLIVSCSIARASIWDVTKANLGFILVLLSVLMLTTYVPAVPMFLVDYFYR